MESLGINFNMNMFVHGNHLERIDALVKDYEEKISHKISRSGNETFIDETVNFGIVSFENDTDAIFLNFVTAITLFQKDT